MRSFPSTKQTNKKKTKKKEKMPNQFSKNLPGIGKCSELLPLPGCIISDTGNGTERLCLLGELGSAAPGGCPLPWEPQAAHPRVDNSPGGGRKQGWAHRPQEDLTKYIEGQGERDLYSGIAKMMKLVNISTCRSFESCLHMGYSEKMMVRALVKVTELHG